MKSIFLIITLLSQCFSAFSQGGVNFEHLTFEEALAKAKAENKLVFMDCYTSWCGPCKYMTDNVFPREKAGNFFNPKFVSVKFDMEKGEGKELSKKFHIKAFPTFFIIRPDGTVQHKIVGGGDLDKIIARVERGLNPKTSLDYLEKLHEQGKMNKHQLMLYQIALNEAFEKEKSAEVGERLNAMLTRKDKMKKEYWPILEKSAYGTTDCQLVLDHIFVFYKNIGKEKVDQYLVNTFAKQLRFSMDSVELLKQMQGELTPLDLPDKALLTHNLELMLASAERDVEKVIALAGEVETNENGELWATMNAINAIRGKATKEDLNRLIRLEDKYMNIAAGNSTDYVANYFESLKIAASVGVYFQNLSYEEALTKAGRQGRKLFIYGFMNNDNLKGKLIESMLEQENISDLLNRNFLCLKYDVEKEEGLKLVKQFGVDVFPTFIIVLPDGSVRQKVEDIHEVEELKSVFAE
ncbi:MULTISPECIES: thioredoxin family protein [Butyricimonas]|uniref:thioredoxin family protein n=1 Tax=Butyricimonas TaxID=574697 RepID=UPI001D08278F|nr:MULTISPECIES: thioredoxin family protein [Butyricimonas]MCB6971015.1 thioredoxin family protein [Butyricimonas synergistica]MCG4517729.1 thioredoxin family protein [Butyricimonas sp. DFI.6.44]